MPQRREQPVRDEAPSPATQRTLGSPISALSRVEGGWSDVDPVRVVLQPEFDVADGLTGDVEADECVAYRIGVHEVGRRREARRCELPLGDDERVVAPVAVICARRHSGLHGRREGHLPRCSMWAPAGGLDGEEQGTALDLLSASGVRAELEPGPVVTGRWRAGRELWFRSLAAPAAVG